MEKEIVESIIKDHKNTNRTVAIIVAEDLCKHQDIASEYLEWTKRRNYDFENPIMSGGYTAKDVYHMAPFLDGVGVYSFLATLRDNPEKANQIINDGFIVM